MNNLPIWKPSQHLIILLGGDGARILKSAFQVFRQSSCAYIAKPKIREFIFNKYNHSCNYCGSTEYLQIDHIVSVYRCFHGDNIYKCNVPENLQLLCRSCNLSKTD